MVNSRWSMVNSRKFWVYQSLIPSFQSKIIKEKIQMKHINIKTIQTPKQLYSTPILKKLGSVLSITLKAGSATDGMITRTP